MSNKKDLKNTIKELSAQNNNLSAKLSLHITTVQAFSKQTEQLIEERNEWRAKYELLMHTPEFKADTEAAFKRGEQSSQAKFYAWLRQVATDLPTILKETTDVD